MEITKLEPVTRTYCDVCGKECTGCYYGDVDGEGIQRDICGRSSHGKSCYEKFRFKRAVNAGDIDFN